MNSEPPFFTPATKAALGETQRAYTIRENRKVPADRMHPLEALRSGINWPHVLIAVPQVPAHTSSEGA
jgi:hypothetical protein